jgi:hypothetical protein
MAFKSAVIDRMMAKDSYLQLSGDNHLQGRRMSKFQPGQEILIPSEVGNGPFPGEQLVTFETSRGPVSGFVPDTMVVDRGGRKFIRAIVRDVTPEAMTVWVQGSFFNTNGLAQVPIDAGLAA